MTRKRRDQEQSSPVYKATKSADVNSIEPLWSERKLSICIFADEKSPHPRRRQKNWREVVDLNREHDCRPKKSGKMLGAYELNGPRANENVVHRSLLQLDVDTEVKKDKASGELLEIVKVAPRLEEVQDKISDFEWFANSSHGHDPGRGIIKYRITILPSRDVRPDEHKALLEALDERLGGILDRAAWGLCQAFYLPSCPKENEGQAFFVYNEGLPLDVDEFVRRGREIISERKPQKNAPRRSERPSPLPETFENIEYVRRLFASIPADLPYVEWRNVLWAVASLGWVLGEELARVWSETAPTKFDERAFKAVWDSYDPCREERINFATIEFLARKYGDDVENSGLTFSGWGSDTFNGRRFAAMYRDKLLHVHETGVWLLFNTEQGWISAPPGEVERAAKSVLAELWSELAREKRTEL